MRSGETGGREKKGDPLNKSSRLFVELFFHGPASANISTLYPLFEYSPYTFSVIQITFENEE